MMFNGFNMLPHTSTAQSTICEYGGLFIFSRSTFGTLTDLYSICSNITRESVLPFEYYHTFGMLMIFVTFEGYSSGSLDLSITKEQECVGLNYLYSYHILDIPEASTGDPIDYATDKAESTMRTDVWVTVNKGSFLDRNFKEFSQLIYTPAVEGDHVHMIMSV